MPGENSATDMASIEAISVVFAAVLVWLSALVQNVSNTWERGSKYVMSDRSVSPPLRGFFGRAMRTLANNIEFALMWVPPVVVKVIRDTGPIEGLNPGGGNFGPDGRYYVGLRGVRTIMAFPTGLDAAGQHVLPPGIVPFPRGFAFGHDSRLFLASAIGPNGEGDDTIVAFAPSGAI